MTRTRALTVLALTLILGGAFALQAQAAEGQRRSGRGFGRDSLLGLLRMEQVQKEMKLTPEQTAKVNEVVEKLGAEMREKYAALREIEDRAERRAKTTALSDEIDDQLRDQLRDALSREQMMRLYQIRMQVRPAAESLANPYVARRLELTEEQQKKVAEVAKQAGRSSPSCSPTCAMPATRSGPSVPEASPDPQRGGREGPGRADRPAEGSLREDEGREDRAREGPPWRR